MLKCGISLANFVEANDHRMSVLRAKTVLVALIMVLYATPALAVQQAHPEPLPTLVFHPSTVQPHLEFLRLQALGGRRTGTPGAQIAASYIVSMLKMWGVEPGAPDGSYLQQVPLVRRQLAPGAFVRLVGGADTVEFKLGTDIAPVTSMFPTLPTPRTKGTLKLTDAGYGLELPEWNDYRWLDVVGSAVLVRTGVPKDLPESVRGLVAGQSGLGLRVNTAWQRGASAIVLVLEGELEQLFEPLVEGVRGTSLILASEPAESLATTGPEVFVTTMDRAARLFSGGGPSAAPGLVGKSLVYDTRRIEDPVSAYNVTGLVRGGDITLIDSYVAAAGHYDGRTPDPRLGPPGLVSSRHDLDAGAAALLAVAREVALGPVRPLRSVLFIWHVAEDQGLLGSRYFVQQSTVPLATIQAVLNVSISEQGRGDSLFVVGPGAERSGRNIRIGQLADSVNAYLPCPFLFDRRYDTPGDPTGAYFRSDHISYARRGVPVIFFTNREYAGGPSGFGIARRSDIEAVGRVAELLYHLTMAVAMNPQGVR